MTATAEALHLTGPAVSQQLAALEKEAGVPLLEQQGRTLRLTPAGQPARRARRCDPRRPRRRRRRTAGAARGVARDGPGRGVPVGGAGVAAAVAAVGAGWRGRRRCVQPALRISASTNRSAPIAALRRGETDVAVVHAYSLLPRACPGLRAAPPAGRAACCWPCLRTRPPTHAACAPGQPADLAGFRARSWLTARPATPPATSSPAEPAGRRCSCRQPRSRLATDFAVLTALVAAGAGVALVPRDGAARRYRRRQPAPADRAGDADDLCRDASGRGPPTARRGGDERAAAGVGDAAETR